MTEKSQRGANLTRQDRERGGRASAAKQVRDSRGQFAGTRGKNKEEHERGRSGEQAHEPAHQTDSEDQASSQHHRNHHGQRQ